MKKIQFWIFTTSKQSYDIVFIKNKTINFVYVWINHNYLDEH